MEGGVPASPESTPARPRGLRRTGSSSGARESSTARSTITPTATATARSENAARNATPRATPGTRAGSTQARPPQSMPSWERARVKNGSSTASTSGSSGISDGATMVTTGAETRLSPSPTRPCIVEPSTTTTASSATTPGLRPRITRDPGSAGEEGEPHLPVRVVHVEVDQADALPGAEREPAVEHRHRGVRRNQCRHHVGATVARAAVPVPPAVISREQVAERPQQVLVGAGPGLDHGDAGSGMRHEQLEQTVALPGDESCAVVGEVQDGVAAARAVLACL